VGKTWRRLLLRGRMMRRWRNEVCITLTSPCRRPMGDDRMVHLGADDGLKPLLVFFLNAYPFFWVPRKPYLILYTHITRKYTLTESLKCILTHVQRVPNEKTHYNFPIFRTTLWAKTVLEWWSPKKRVSYSVLVGFYSYFWESVLSLSKKQKNESGFCVF
jgi:hypothetical protein